MKNKILFLFALIWLPLAAAAGDIKPGAVPGSINYQGRLERDNAPITGVIHLFFRIYNAASAGTMRWQSPELIVTAAQGIFSANIVPPWDVFSRSETLYLEVQVESDVLTPREPLNSVAYALVAKKLEDGASISVTTLTAANQVSLATVPYSNVDIGSNTPGNKLNVSGVIQLSGSTSQICFNDTSCMGSAGLGTAVGGVTSNGVSVIQSGVLGTGEMHFNTANVERIRITDNVNGGKIAIGLNSILNGPLGTLDVDGSLYIGNAGIYDRDDAELNVKQDMVVEGGRVRGIGQNYLSIGETADTIIAATNNTQRVWIDPAGNVGVGLSGPAEPMHTAGNIRANTGVRGGVVSMGGYTGWTSAANEVRSQTGSHLLLQLNNPFNVGIGTDTPREKLHVHGSVLADYGVLASTAGFTGDVGVNGNFTANGLNKQVFLTSTTIYGTLQVTGGIGSMAGFPAYIASTQTLTGLNTFTNQVVVSSDIMTPSRIGAAMKDFNFGAGRYLQVGDNKAEYSAQNTVAYLVGGDSANSRLAFYRGPALAGSLETQNGSNLAVVVGGQTKTLTDSVYHRIQNSVVWISTGVNTTPAIYVSSQMGNVGIGTAVSDPTYKLTVDGSIRIAGPTSNGIVFSDGSTMKSAATIGAAMSIANSGDAIVAANTLGGGGSVVLRSGSLDGLVLDSSGRVGIGTLYPVSKLNVRGGDLILGTPINPYSGGPENLIVAGNIVFDGSLIQRSLSPTLLSGLIVASDVYLSTGPSAMTGVGTLGPLLQRLQVGGDINIESGGGIRINNTAASANYLRGDGTRFVSSAIQDGDIPATIVRTSRNINTTTPLSGGGTLGSDKTLAVGGLSSMGTGNYVVGVAAGAGSWEYKNIVGAANEIDVTHGVNSITIGIVDPLGVAKGGTGLASWTQGDLLYASAGTTISALAKDTTATRYLSNTGSSNNPAWSQVNMSNGVTGTLAVGNGGTGATTLSGVIKGNAAAAFTAMTGTANTLTKWTAADTIGNSVITDDGSTVNINTHRITNVVDPTGAQDAATMNYVDSQMSSTSGRTWNRSGNFVGGSDFLGSTNSSPVVIKTNGTIAMTITTGQALQLANPLGVAYGGTGNASGNAVNVTGIVAVANGGTGNSSGNAPTASALAADPGDCTLPTVAVGINASGVAQCSTPTNVTGTAANVTGTVAVANGGTGLTGGTAGKLICWKTASTLGMCIDAPSASGCTCN